MASKPKKNPANHALLSKADIAEMLNISSQLLSNKASRAAEKGEYFPEPTYSNRAGTVTLYTIEDAKEVYEYVTKAERERLKKAEAAFAQFGQSFEEPTLDLDEKPADKPADKPAPAAAEKAADKWESKPTEKVAAKVADKPAAAPAKVTTPKLADAPAKPTEKPAAAADAKAPAKTEAPKVDAKAPAKTEAPKTGAPAKSAPGISFMKN